MMNTLMQFMTNRFSPIANKISKNSWVSSIQDAIMTILPLILVGSIVTVLSLLKNMFPEMPDLSMINSFSFGVVSLGIAYLIPYNILDKKGYESKKLIAGVTGVALFLIFIEPVMAADGTITFIQSRFGAEGMFVSITAGLITGLVMYLFSKHSFFSDSTAIPDFVVVWFDSLLPITLLLLFGWGMNATGVDLFELVFHLFQPLGSILNTFTGFVLFEFSKCFLFSFGISPWILTPISYPILLASITANAELVASGQAASFIASNETNYAFLALGGLGSTITLVIMMLLFSKSQRLKAIGKATLIPSIFNINEPVVFGAPIVLNPYLMVPFWLNALILPAVTYFVLSIGLINIPSQTFLLWYMPIPFSTYMATQDFRAIFLLGLNLVLSFMIYYPFFKLYDTQECKEEAKEGGVIDDYESC